MSSTLKSSDEANTVAPTKLTRDSDFCFTDADIILLAGGRRIFRVHGHKLREFPKLKYALEGDEGLSGILQLPDDPDDFRNTFKVMYTSPYAAQPTVFDAAVLVSALRIATNYQTDALCTFAMHGLEEKLPLIEHIPIARKFKILEWEDRAIQNLILRKAPVTLEEAIMLEPQAFVVVAAQRELKASARSNTEGPEPSLLDRFRRPPPQKGSYNAHKRPIADAEPEELSPESSKKICTTASDA